MAVLVQLARSGDIINVLPLALCLSKKIGRVNWVVSRDHASILEGASYVNAIPWDGNQDTLHAAVRHYQSAQPIVTQAYHNPDQRILTESFALEQWRYAGMLGERNKWNLIFDQPNPARANMLRDRVLANRHRGRPLILCATTSISTPYPHANRLIASIRGLDADVIDLNDVRAERIYDLIALYDAADCLVTVDTAHLHLARAAKCPVVALINDGWKGAVPPPQTVASWRYRELGDDLSPVVEATEKVITASASRTGTFVLVANVFGQSERHLKARENWPHKQVIAKKSWGRNAKKTIGNDRALPFLKDLLQAGLDSGAECIVHTNDDCAFAPNAFYEIQKHCAVFDFGCVRRDPTHCGREAFFFKSSWLRKNISAMPDAIIGIEKWDHVICKWLRKFRGIPTTDSNLLTDFFPVELPPGLIDHASHASWWTSDEAIKSPATRHNFALWEAVA